MSELEYSNGWRLSNGKKIFYKCILRDKVSLKETRRFKDLEDFNRYAEQELKINIDELKLSKDRRFLFETNQFYVEVL